MVTLVLVKNPFSPQDGREIRHIEAQGTLADLLELHKLEGVDLLATINGYSVDNTMEIHDGDFIVIYPAIQKGGKGGKGILGIIAAIALSVVAMGVGGLIATGVWGSFAGASALAATGGYLAAAAIMFLGSSLIGRTSGQKVDTGSYDGGDGATYSWAGVTTMEGQNNPIALTYGLVKSGGQTIGKYTMAQGDNDYLYWLVACGEGPLSIDEIRLNDNTIGMYKEVRYEVRRGTNDQDIISFFGDTHFTQNLSYNMEEIDTWFTASAQGTSTEGLIVKIECPQGLYHVTDKGKTVTNTIGIQVQIRRDDVATPVWQDYSYFPADMSDYDSSRGALMIRGSSNKAVRREYRVDRIKAGEYSVRVRVVYRNYSDSSRDGFAVYWTGVSSIVYDDFCYPNTALIGIKAKATGQLSGAPTLTFKKWRTVVYVWNPYAKEYQQKHANNPAWACYDLIHQAKPLKNINTGGYEYEVRGAPAHLMRYDDFASWAAYCEGKKYYVNIEIVSAGEMLDVCNQKLAPIGHGKVVRFGTKYGCIYSHPQEAVQMFGMGNIVTGSFNEEFLKIADRANCVEVTFTNAEAGYERDVLTIYSDTFDSDGYAKTAQVTMDGITKYSQAYREGVYQLLCNKYQLRTISFECGIDAIACTVGDVVLVSHDVPKWANSGRIEKVEGRTLTLPIEITNTLASYRIQYRKQNDTLYTYAVTVDSSEEGWTTVTLPDTVPAGKLPEPGDIFDLAEATAGSKPFVVQGITRAQDFTRTISCIEYDERVFAEPGNYNPDESDETVFTVTVQQTDFQTITVRAFRGVTEERYTSSFTKEETGWQFDIVVRSVSGYAPGRLFVNGRLYTEGDVLSLNKDYMVVATASEVGAEIYANGSISYFTFGWEPSHWNFFSDYACTKGVDRSSLMGRIVVHDISQPDARGRFRGQCLFGASNDTVSGGHLKYATEIIQNIHTGNMTTLNEAFAYCQSMVKVDVTDWDVGNCSDMSSMFASCSLLKDLGDISHWNTVSLTTASGMFSECDSLISIDLSGWTTTALTNVGNMFFRSDSLQVIDISNWDTANITNTGNMVGSCPALRYVIMDKEEIKFSGNVSMPNANNNVKYLVPASMVDAYKAHPNWSGRAARIDSISNYTIIRADGHVSVVEGG